MDHIKGKERKGPQLIEGWILGERMAELFLVFNNFSPFVLFYPLLVITYS